MGSDYYGFIEVKTSLGWESTVNLDRILGGNIISEDLQKISKKNGCPPNPSKDLKNCIAKLLSVPGSKVFNMDIDEQDWETPDFDFSSHNVSAYWFNGENLDKLSESEKEEMSVQFVTALEMVNLLKELYGVGKVRAFVYEKY